MIRAYSPNSDEASMLTYPGTVDYKILTSESDDESEEKQVRCELWKYFLFIHRYLLANTNHLQIKKNPVVPILLPFVDYLSSCFLFFSFYSHLSCLD